MNKIESVEIAGFWGDRKLLFPFYPDVNFLIGVNGSGKTTAINIIAAALTADFETLDRLPFELIIVSLSEVGGRKKPSIKITKCPSEDSPYSTIEYQIRKTASEPYKTYSLDNFEEERLLRRGIPPRYYQRHLRQMNRGILAMLRSLVNVSWLSIHRASQSQESHEARSYESSVDQKLDELGNALVKYFSLLNTKVTDELEKFQKNIIVSLLTEQTEQVVFSSVMKLSLEEEKNSLVDIFRKLDLADKRALNRLDKYFRGVADSLNKMDAKEGLDLKALMSITSYFRSHKIVQDWNTLLKGQKSILEPRRIFLDVLNGLYQRKKIDIGENNELLAITQSGKHLAINSLSSGEKQLLIILGEALLEQEAPWVYIADEPELSLHVTWQEKLISNLRQINPSAQIICATHSPDIVSVFSNKIFDMEKIVE
jgi:predicted ATP-dependent endonuclease of OLD family